MSKSIHHSSFLPSKHSSGNKTFRERDPKLFDKLHNEQLRQVKLSVRKHSIERYQKTEQELTFQPRVKSRFGKKRRSLEEFISDMDKFQQEKEENHIVGISKKLIEQDYIQNSLFKKYKQDDYSKVRINELYKDGVTKQRERSNPKRVRPQSQHSTFIPRISNSAQKIRRTEQISDILYTDALRRRKRKHRRVKSALEFHKEKTTKDRKRDSRSRCRRIIKLHEANQIHNKGEQYLDFEAMKVILAKIGMKKYRDIQKSKTLSSVVWETLKDHPKDRVIHINKLNNLVSNSCLLLPNRRKSLEAFKTCQSGSRRSLHKQGSLIVNKTKKGSKFNHNESLGKDNTFVKKYVRPQAQKATPAPSHRKKISFDSRVNTILRQKQDYYLKMYEKKKMEEEREMKECSFKPNIIPNPKKRTPLQPVRAGAKNLQLYKMAEKINKERHADKTTDQVNFEKSRHECTFRPNIIPYPTKDVKSRLDLDISAMNSASTGANMTMEQNSIVKVQNFKEDSQVKNKDFKDFVQIELEDMLDNQRRLDRKATEDRRLISPQSSDSESPILFLDVNFGNGEVTRIVMYENDKPEELAEAFCKENGLDITRKDRLVEIIYQQLETVLEKIEEESEDVN